MADTPTQPQPNTSVVKPLQFFVYVVESPSAPDIYHDRSEGNIVGRAIHLDLIPCVTRVAINKEAFNASLVIGLQEEMKAHPNLLPIVHISAHGGSSGLLLSSNELITWNHLRDLLLPINAALSGGLLLCMSSCEGFSACRMAMNETGDQPFFGVIGNYGTPTWSDTAIAYASFYHLISKGVLIVDAVKAMKAASGDTGWSVMTAKEARTSFIEFIKKTNPQQVQKELQDNVQEQRPTSEMKKLETNTLTK
jgi:hypothetical protein